MVTKTQKFRLGVFITFISLIMLIFMIMVAGNKLMEKRDYYQIIYKDISVSGLQVGGSVKYHGINIGRVDDITIDKDDIRNVIVKISIRAGIPVKEDVIASLIPVGITGLLQVELSGGTNEAELLEPGSNIIPGTSIFESISGKAEIITEKLERVLDNLTKITDRNNQEKISGILTSVDSILSINQEPFNNIMISMDSIAVNLVQLTKESSQAVEKLNRIIQSEQFANIINNSEKVSRDLASADITQLITDLNKAINKVSDTFAHIDQTHLKTRQDIIQTIETLRETIDYLNEFSRQISEEPSILIRSKKK
jgi:phospholipid/cholesterol/gamma-HCH transport system substrate-binding protein